MKTIPWLALALGALLAGCGGGGGDSGSAMPAPTVAITGDNQTTVARATLDGGLALGQAQALEDGDRATAQSTGALPSSARLAWLGRAVQRAAAAGFMPRRRAGIASAARPAAVTSSTQPCALSGSVTTAFDDADGDGDFSGRDVLTVSFNACSDAPGDFMDGAMVFTIASVAAASETDAQMGGTLAFQAVSIAVGDASAAIDGSVSFALQMTADSMSMSLAIGADGLTADLTAPGYADSIVYAPGTQITIAESGSGSVVTLNGSFEATSIGGRVTVATLQPLTQSATDANPSTGELRVTGAAGSQLRILVLNDTQVELRLDANGDGTFESSTLTTWEALLSA